MARKPPLKADRPIDPRARDVVHTVSPRKRHYELHLVCGHIEHRQMRCPPSRVICHTCPPVGGDN